MPSGRTKANLDSNEKRASLLAMPDFGKVRQAPSRPNPFIDFHPDIRDPRHRFLWSFMGKAFQDEAEAQLVRNRINARALEVGLEEAVNQFRSARSRADLLSNVVENFLNDAPSMGSLRHSAEPYSTRTLDHYRTILRRAQPYFEGMTMRQFFKTDELLRFKGWFRKEARPEDAPPEPGKYGRGLKTDNEMTNCFAALRAVVNYYRLTHPDFSVDWPSNPTKTTIAKRTRKERRSRTGKREASLSLPQVVHAIEEIDENRQPIFWAMFFTQCRITEARAVLGMDYIFEDQPGDDRLKRGRIFIERSADSKGAQAQIQNTTKTGVDGSYLLPEFVRTLIANHCSHARFDPRLPLFRNPHCLAKGNLWTDDALSDTWKSALSRLGLPWVPVYKSLKHTQISALRDSGLPVDDIVEQCRWTSRDMMERYDSEQDQRRDGVVNWLASLVDDAKS
jgi:hypothetical protein